MTKKDGILIRWLSRRNNVSFKALSEKFSVFEIRGAFKRGLIKMNADRDGYTLTKESIRILNKDNQHPILCVHCFTYHLKYDHFCSGCHRVTKYREALNERIVRRKTARISGANSKAETRREPKQA